MTVLSRTLGVLFVVAGSLAACPSLAQDKAAESVDLKPHLAKGQTATFVLDQTRKDTTTLPGRPPMDMNLHQAVTYQMTVLEAGETGTTVELKITEIHATSDGVAGKFKYDSDAPKDDSDRDNTLLKTMVGLIGAPFKITLDAKGNPTKVDNAGLEPPNSPFASMVTTHINQDAIRMRWSALLSPRKGDGKAKVGESWTTTDSQDSRPVGKFTFDTTYTLTGVKGDRANIGLVGKVSISDISEKEKTEFTVKESQTTGSITWDTKAGLPVEAEQVQKTSIEGSAQGITLARASDVTTKVTRSK